MGILDRVGKRRTMLLTYPGMILGLALAAVAFHFMTESTGGIVGGFASLRFLCLGR